MGSEKLLTLFPNRALLLVLAIALAGTVTGQVDPTFNAVPSIVATSGIAAPVVQPDGKVILSGGRMVVDGVAKSEIVRLNTDGTADPTFSYCGCAIGAIRNIMLAPDGKIIVAGSTSNNAKIIRLNQDGSVDPGFSVFSAGPPPFFGGAEFSVHAVQPDGKVLAMLRVSSSGYVAFYLDRYNADGTVDAGFPRIGLAGGSPMAASLEIELLPSGKFYMALTAGVTGNSATLTRRNSDGSLDSSWTAPNFGPVGFGSFTSIRDLEALPDESVLVAGNWQTVNGVAKRYLIKLLPAGNVDLDFATPPVHWGLEVERLPDGKIIFSGSINVTGSAPAQIFRLNADGTIDNTFTQDPSIYSVGSWQLDPSGRIVINASFVQPEPPGATLPPRLVRLLSNGSIDPSFNANITFYGTVNATAVQGDGKVLIAGVYQQMNGIPRNAFSRVNADGSLDPTFDPGTGFDSPPTQLLLQPDGKILAVGGFASYNGTSVPGIARINANGSLDNTFTVSVSPGVACAALQPDGRILIGGTFSTVGGQAMTGLARLLPSGALDTTFNVTIGSPNIRAILVDPDGKIVIGGGFSGVNGFNRNNLVRLTSTGALDESFAATSEWVEGIWRQADGKYVLTIGSPAFSMSRRNINGSVDTSFTPPTFSSGSSSSPAIYSVLIVADGSMLVGGAFATVSGSARPNIVRLAPNGTPSPLFLPAGANNTVRSIVGYPGGKAIVGGAFSTIGDVSKPGIARLDVPAFIATTPFDFDGDGKADVAVYRPSTGVWYQLFSSGNPYGSPTFGLSGDIPVPADYDGDGKTDVAIFRPSSGDWWYRASNNGSLRSTHWGQSGDIPVPADINNDGTDDFVVFRPSNNFWYRITTTGTADQKQFGLAGDKPVVGDFDGDGKADQAIFRPSSGDWWYSASSAGGVFRSTHWGQNGDIPAPADFDGDGKTDLAVFRPSNGAWYILKSSDLSYTILAFGVSGDRPAPADYDGDGKADIAVFRPSTGVWYMIQSTAGTAGVQWGVSTDVAIPNAFVSN